MFALGLLMSANTTFGQSNSTGITLEKLIFDEGSRYKKERDYLEKKMLDRKNRAIKLRDAALAAIGAETPDSIVVQKGPMKKYLSDLEQIYASTKRLDGWIDEDYQKNLKRAKDKHEEMEAMLLARKTGDRHHVLVGYWEGPFENDLGGSGVNDLSFFFANRQLMVEHDRVQAEVKGSGTGFLFQMEFPSLGYYRYSVALGENGKKMTVRYTNLSPKSGDSYSGTWKLSKSER